MGKKVIIIGLDGLEPTIVEAMLARGALPHFAKIRDQGFYCRLKTTYPALTPVAWSSFVTGTNPGGHGIFDFIRRDPATYRPDLALSRFEPPRNMFTAPKVVNRRQGIPFWNLLTAAGVPSTILRCPCTFPPDAISGRMLAGVGVPDLRGSQGTGTFYTQDISVGSKESEQVIRLNAGSEFKTHVIGPRNTKSHSESDSVSEIHVTVNTEQRTISIKSGASEIEIREGTWGPWLRPEVQGLDAASGDGSGAFFCSKTDPSCRVLRFAVNFDAEAPLFPVASPAEYGKELTEKIGLFGTLGMAEDHAGLNNGRFKITVSLHSGGHSM